MAASTTSGLGAQPARSTDPAAGRPGRGRAATGSDALDDGRDCLAEADAHRTPRRSGSSRRSSSPSSVAVIRAPVAPSGWPSEMPPPFGFTSPPAGPRARCRRRNWRTTANASLTSITDMSGKPSAQLAIERLGDCRRVARPASAFGSTPANPVATNARSRSEAVPLASASPLALSSTMQLHRRRSDWRCPP